VVLLDREGHSTPLIGESDFWAEPRLSPDGQSLALRRVSIPDCSLWVFDRKRSLLTRVPVDGDVHAIAWTSDGKGLVFRLERRGRTRVCRIAADGSGAVEEISHGEVDYKSAIPLPDGSGYVCTVQGKGADGDLVLLDAASGESRALLATPANEGGGSVSPDARWLAYTSDESGRPEVYLRSFPDVGHRVQVSSAGGSRAHWSRDGKQLFFTTGERLMCVTIGADPALLVSAPVPVFPDALQLGARVEYDPLPDGTGFVAIVGEPVRRPGTLRVVLRWPQLLEGAALR
jgi:serine/threonine-protein kinase